MNLFFRLLNSIDCLQIIHRLRFIGESPISSVACFERRSIYLCCTKILWTCSPINDKEQSITTSPPKERWSCDKTGTSMNYDWELINRSIHLEFIWLAESSVWVSHSTSKHDYAHWKKSQLIKQFSTMVNNKTTVEHDKQTHNTYRINGSHRALVYNLLLKFYSRWEELFVSIRSAIAICLLMRFRCKVRLLAVIIIPSGTWNLIHFAQRCNSFLIYSFLAG